MRLTIKLKLATAFAGVLGVMAGAGYYAVHGLHSSNENMQVFVTRPYNQTKRVADAARGLQNLGRNINRMLASSDDAEMAEIRKAVDKYLRSCGVTVVPFLQFDNIQMIKEAVAIGSGISILPEPTIRAEVAQGRLVPLPLVGPALVRPLGIIHRRGKKLSPAAEHFLEFLQSKA